MDQATAENDRTMSPLQRCRRQLLERWKAFPAERLVELDALLCSVLAATKTTDLETIMVMDPVSRPRRMRLAKLCEPASLDDFYRNESAELAVCAEGVCYLLYRRRDGDDYAVTWSPATTLPSALLTKLPDVLALALLEDETHG